MLTNARKALAAALLDIGAVQFGQFRLKLHETRPDAPLSPIYIDLRVLRSFPDVMDSAVAVYKELVSGLEVDLYADVPTAATPLAALLSHETRIPLISPRKEEKGHGTGRQIDGVFKPGQTALLIDDLITLADSKIEAISALEANGLKVRGVVVLVDREQGGVQELEKRGYACRVAFGLKELLQFYRDSGRITAEQQESTLRYLQESHPS